MLSFVTPALCNPIRLRKHSRYSFPTTPWVYICLFPSFIPPPTPAQILWKVDLSEKQTNKNFIPESSQLTWIKYTRAEAITAGVRTPIGLNSSCFSKITHWMSLPPFHAPCHVQFPDLEALRREVFSAVNQFFLFSLSFFLLPWAFIFCSLSLLFHPGFFLYFYFWF